MTRRQPCSNQNERAEKASPPRIQRNGAIARCFGELAAQITRWRCSPNPDTNVKRKGFFLHNLDEGPLPDDVLKA